MTNSHFNRRNFLRWSGLGAALLATGGAGALLSACSTEPAAATATTAAATATGGALPTVTPAPTTAALKRALDAEYSLRATPTSVSIFPGKETNVWAYRGKPLGGDPASLQPVGDSYLGPTFRVKKGQRIRINFTNELPEESITHWHGFHIPDDMDGHPRFAVGSGESYTYEFDILNRAGMYWYHPHPHGRTGPQVYGGMAGLFIVSDDEEAALGLPAGDYDIPLVLQDRVVDNDNQLVYLPNGMMDQMMGFLGNRLLVNGKPEMELSVERRAYRLRFLNGSNSRIYKLGWADGTPLTVIGTDGGLLEKPVQRNYVTLAPAERIELWVDFSRWELGSELTLKSLPFFGATPGNGSGVPNGAEFSVLTVKVAKEAAENPTLPETLTPIPRYRAEDAVNGDNPRRFEIAMARMQWLLNGRTFEMTATAPNEVVKLDTLEMWEFVNTSGGMGMMGGGMAHPMHVHGLQFQVVERQVASRYRSAWESVSEGYVDEGWKDAVLLMPGERVKLLMKFEDFTGLYLYHCHNLEHEDMGLMRNYRVEA